MTQKKHFWLLLDSLRSLVDRLCEKVSVEALRHIGRLLKGFNFGQSSRDRFIQRRIFGRLFVQNGHEVTRIETAQPPAWASSEAMTTFLHAGKERIHANSKDFADLAAKADIVVLEASSADRAASFGVDRWVTPIKVVLSPFGLTGPKRNWRATPHLARDGRVYADHRRCWKSSFVFTWPLRETRPHNSLLPPRMHVLF